MANGAYTPEEVAAEILRALDSLAKAELAKAKILGMPLRQPTKMPDVYDRHAHTIIDHDLRGDPNWGVGERNLLLTPEQRNDLAEHLKAAAFHDAAQVHGPDTYDPMVKLPKNVKKLRRPPTPGPGGLGTRMSFQDMLDMRPASGDVEHTPEFEAHENMVKQHEAAYIKKFREYTGKETFMMDLGDGNVANGHPTREGCGDMHHGEGFYPALGASHSHDVRVLGAARKPVAGRDPNLLG